MGGPRFFHQIGRAVPFVQVLVGGAHARAKLRVTPGGGQGDVTGNFSETDVALQPGGGVTVYFSERVGFRLAGDFLSLLDYADGEWDVANQFRAIAGLTFGWGAR